MTANAKTKEKKQIDLVRKLTLQQIQVAHHFLCLKILKKNGIRTPSKSDLMPAVLVGVKNIENHSAKI